jgi:nucleotide-binding universal stress UspA family protein
MLMSIKDVMRKDSEDGLKELEARVKKDLGDVGVVLHYESRQGSLVSVVHDLASDFNAEMIVMGTKGASGIEAVLIGSNTTDVIKNVKFPVVAVPEQAVYSSIKKVVFATDYKLIQNYEIVNPLKVLIEKTNAHLEIVNVTKASTEDASAQAEKEKNNEMFQTDDHEFTHVQNADIVKGIQAHIQDTHTDMLVMIIRKHNLFEALFKPGITKTIALHSSIPLMVLHS